MSELVLAETFAELPIGMQFEVTDVNAPFPMYRAPLVRTKAGKWSPPRHPRWTLDYNAVRRNPRGDDWDRCWVNSNYYYYVDVLSDTKILHPDIS